MIRTNTLILISFLFLTALSCNDKYEKCGGIYPVKLSDISVELVKVDSNGRSFANLGKDDSIPSSQLGFYLNFENVSANLLNPKPAYSFFSSAYACPPSISSTEETVKDIKIICNQDFNIDFPKGSNLANICYISLLESHDRAPYFDAKTPLTNFIKEAGETPLSAIIGFTEKPQTAGSYQFDITYLQNGIDVDSVKITTMPVRVFVQ